MRHLVYLIGLTLASGALAQQERELTVLTFNAWHGLRSGENKKKFPGEDDERREQRLQWQFDELRRLAPDVMIFQEVNPAQPLARRYAEELGYDEIHKTASCGVHLGKVIKIPKNVNEGLAILARPELGLRRVGTKRLSGNATCTATFGFQTKESRYVLIGEIQWNGQAVLIAATHLSVPSFMPPGFDDGLQELVNEGVVSWEQRDEIIDHLDRKRARNLAEATKLLEVLDRRGERLGRPPLILGGDFNATPDSASVAAVEQQLTSVAQGEGFVTWDPVGNAANHEIGNRRSPPIPTFDIPQIEELLAPRDSIPRQIDHLFVSDDWEVRSTRRVLDDERDGIYPSDHYGIMATIALP